MEQIKLTILGEPTPQPRHRHFSRGKGDKSFVQTYDPAKQKKNSFLSIVHDQAPESPFDCPLAVEIEFYFSRPKNHYGTGRNEGVLKSSAPKFHTNKRFDIDNLMKFCLDALNKIFWTDDGIICAGEIKKYYAKEGESPRTIITIIPLEEDDYKLF